MIFSWVAMHKFPTSVCRHKMISHWSHCRILVWQVMAVTHPSSAYNSPSAGDSTIRDSPSRRGSYSWSSCSGFPHSPWRRTDRQDNLRRRSSSICRGSCRRHKQRMARRTRFPSRGRSNSWRRGRSMRCRRRGLGRGRRKRRMHVWLAWWSGGGDRGSGRRGRRVVGRMGSKRYQNREHVDLPVLAPLPGHAVGSEDTVLEVGG